MDRPGTTSARLIGRAQDGRCLDDLIYPMTRTSTTITQRHAQYCAVVIQWKFFVVLLHWIDTQHEYYSGEYCISTRNESTRANWKLLTRDELRQDWSRGESEGGMGLPQGGNLNIAIFSILLPLKKISASFAMAPRKGEFPPFLPRKIMSGRD